MRLVLVADAWVKLYPFPLAAFAMASRTRAFLRSTFALRRARLTRALYLAVIGSPDKGCEQKDNEYNMPYGSAPRLSLQLFCCAKAAPEGFSIGYNLLQMDSLWITYEFLEASKNAYAACV